MATTIIILKGDKNIKKGNIGRMKGENYLKKLSIFGKSYHQKPKTLARNQPNNPNFVFSCCGVAQRSAISNRH